MVYLRVKDVWRVVYLSGVDSIHPMIENFHMKPPPFQMLSRLFNEVDQNSGLTLDNVTVPTPRHPDRDYLNILLPYH